MIYFIGAGPGAPDLISIRGKNMLEKASMIVYAGSLVNPELLEWAPSGCEIFDSASMTLDEVVDTMKSGVARGFETIVRLHTGDPSLYGAVREQMDRLRANGIAFEVIPGISSFSAAAAALQAEYTLPGVSQTLILTRMEGRTPVPESESIRSLASHRASMVLFLSSGMIEKLCVALVEGGYAPDTPAALVYKASWPDQKILRTKLSDLPRAAEDAGIRKTALVLVGNFLGDDYDLSLLYDASFSHGYRKAKNGGA